MQCQCLEFYLYVWRTSASLVVLGSQITSKVNILQSFRNSRSPGPVVSYFLVTSLASWEEVTRTHGMSLVHLRMFYQRMKIFSFSLWQLIRLKNRNWRMWYICANFQWFPGIFFAADSCAILLLHNTTLLLFDCCLIIWKYETAEKLYTEKKIMLSRPSSISIGLFLVMNSAVQEEQEEGVLGNCKDCRGSWVFCKMES